MNSVQPFAYAREFVAVVPPAAVEDLSGELERLRIALAEAEARGRAAGEAAAEARLREERDTALLSACDALQATLEEWDARFHELQAQLADDAAELAYEAAELIAGEAIARDAAGAIESAIGRALAELRRGTPVEVRVHPELQHAMEQRLAARQAGERRRLKVAVIADTGIPAGDARLSWERGGARVDQKARRELVRRELAELRKD